MKEEVAESFVHPCEGLFAMYSGQVCRVSYTCYSPERGYRWVLTNFAGKNVASIVANSSRSCEADSFPRAVALLITDGEENV